MSFFPLVSVRLTLTGLAIALSFSACSKKPVPEPAPPVQAAQPVAVSAPDSAPAPPPVVTATEQSPDFDKMSTEDKYWGEMADSITSFIQDHLRAKGRMPKDAKDVVDLKIMTRVDVPPNYTLLIDQKTGKATFKKVK